MKVVKAKEMSRIEKLAYEKGAKEEAFMNAAGRGIAEGVQKFSAKYHLKPNIVLLCGKGNNAGDAYVAGRILNEGGFHVRALAFASYEESSPLCQLQSKRFTEKGGKIEYIKNDSEIAFTETSLLVDGILGTGFHGEVEGLFKKAIERANASGLPILAIDIASGIDGNTGKIGGIAIQATETLFLGLPKSGCFIEDAWNYTGKVKVFDFGLSEEFIEKAAADFILITDKLVGKILPKIVRTRHKYQAGYVVGLGGSPGMPGAPIMSSFAAIRAGAGIVRLLHPKGMEAELSSAPLEVIRQGYEEGDEKSIILAMERASAIFIGPGMGISDASLHMLKKILPNLKRPVVIDADALTLLSKSDIVFPKDTILTPHHGEMKRLLRIEGDLSTWDLLEKAQKFTEEKKVTLVLKGAPTFIFHPGKTPYVSARGDPGMATAGSGDVLTGIIAAFLAQTHDPLKGAILGVQFHAIAGEHAAMKVTPYCMAATDITEALPAVFKEFKKPFY